MQNLQFPWQNGRTWVGALILLNLQQGEKHHATGQGRLHQLQPWSFQLMLFPLKNSTQPVGGGGLSWPLMRQAMEPGLPLKSVQEGVMLDFHVVLHLLLGK